MQPRFTAAVGRGMGSTRSRRRIVAGALAAATAVGLTIGATAPAQAAPSPKGVEARSVDINLVTVNDFHGRIEQDGAAGGIAALATAVNSFRAENPNTVFAAAGDMIGASTFTSFIQQDTPTIEALNAAGLDVSAVGNHEFDKGFADLTDRVMPLADWEYLGANVRDAATGDAVLPEYWLKKFQGVTIGFVGAVTDELPSLVSPAGIAGLTVERPVAAANRVADQLSDGKKGNGEADIVIMLVHEGAATTDVSSAVDPNSRFGDIVLNANDNIDAIVSGHTHLPYNHVIDGRPVISSGQYGERFSNMQISFDRATKSITKMENTIYTMAVRNDKGDVIGYNYEQDPAIAASVAEAKKIADELGNVEIGSTTAAIGRAVRAPAPPVLENRGGESTLGNLVADVQKWALEADGTRDVDITFMNPGGLRADLDSGSVTYREAAAVQPFANTLVTFDLTAAQIKQVLEEQWQPTGATRPFLKLGVNEALTYTYDPAAAAGSHITEILLDGVPLDPAASYTVGANSFLASGGDNFFTLAHGTGKADSGKIDLEAMVDYFNTVKTVSPDFAQRAVGVVVSAPDADGYDVGDSVTVNLSSLDFSRDEPFATTATVSLDGAVLGSSPVVRTIAANVDEVGTATVTFTIPAGASGAERFAVTTATGTMSSFLLTVD
ncbi:bifunctional metallophosphatase/5'-nucleotidase [Agromyces sp. NPDC055520]